MTSLRNNGDRVLASSAVWSRLHSVVASSWLCRALGSVRRRIGRIDAVFSTALASLDDQDAVRTVVSFAAASAFVVSIEHVAWMTSQAWSESALWSRARRAVQPFGWGDISVRVRLIAIVVCAAAVTRIAGVLLWTNRPEAVDVGVSSGVFLAGALAAAGSTAIGRALEGRRSGTGQNDVQERTA